MTSADVAVKRPYIFEGGSKTEMAEETGESKETDQNREIQKERDSVSMRMA